MPDIVDKFSAHLKNVLNRALNIAVEVGASSIEPSHLLWGLMTEPGGASAEILKRAGMRPDVLSRKLEVKVPAHIIKGEQSIAIPKLSKESRQAIEKAVLTANLFEQKYIGTEHLLLALLHTAESSIVPILKEENIAVDLLRQHLSLLLRGSQQFPNFPFPHTGRKPEPVHLHDHEDHSHRVTHREREEPTDISPIPALEYCAMELTTHKALTKLDPVIGRETEIRRVMDILARRTKNNPVLIGEAGVGKTAIVEGIARHIVEGTAPSSLRTKRIFALDMGSLVAGTMYRGDFEMRIKQIVEEVQRRPEIILFVDEIHTLMGAGNASGSLDAANILKPALARGNMRLIGATTPAEYKKTIETDAALERRLEPIFVHEPDAAMTLSILEGVAKSLEKHHGLCFPKETLVAAVQYTERYLPERHFPDKAIDILDEAAARVRLNTAGTLTPDVEKAIAEVRSIRAERLKAFEDEKIDEVKTLRLQEDRLDKILQEHMSAPIAIQDIAVTVQDIAQAIERRLGRPVGSLHADEHKRLAILPTLLKEQILGQDQAVEAIGQAIARAMLGLTNEQQPLAAFLLTGPSGSGKSFCAEIVAEHLFGKQAIVRFSGSEFAEPHSIAKLIGSPAGYVGYRDANQLTDSIAKRPYQCVLFDEWDKAHSSAHNLLLQLLERGELVDSTGKKVSFRHTIVFVTSNVGAELFSRGAIGFSGGNEIAPIGDVLKALRNRFRPELLQRFRGTFVFTPPNQAALQGIAKRELNTLAQRAARQGTRVKWSTQVERWLATQAIAQTISGPEKGAGAGRLVRTLTDAHVADALARAMLQEENAKSLVYTVTLVSDQPVALAQKAPKKKKITTRSRQTR